MIKIEISNKKIKEIELEHQKWYLEKIIPNLKNKVIKLKDSNNIEISVYTKLLEKILNEGKEYVTNKIFLKEIFDKEIINLLKVDKKNKKSEIEELLKKEFSKNYKEFLPRKIFNYENFSKIDNDWGRHKLLYKLGIEVCPYCQRNYISNYEVNNIEKTTADLDHFFPKSKFPLLSLCLYNFIPSCQICNSRFKLDKEVYNNGLKIIYPYKDSFDEYGVKFTLTNEVVEEILGKNKEFEVKFKFGENIKIEKKNQIENSINIFGLDKVYKKSHNGYIINMLENIIKYPESHLNDIENMLNEVGINNKNLKIIFKEWIKKPYKYKIENKEPLGKLTKDILEQFEVEI